MASQILTQTRELVRGEKYSIGEAVVDPTTKRKSFVLDNTPSNFVVVRNNEYDIQEIVYDCSGGFAWRNAPPEFIKIHTIDSFNGDFSKYQSFIKQHGGNQ